MTDGGVLRVDPEALRTAATSFHQTSEALAGLQAEQPLEDAAAAVPQLQTAGACRTAVNDVAAATRALAQDARMFAGRLSEAAAQYQSRDQAGADGIEKVEGVN